MSIKSTLAKVAPKAAVRKGIAKGSHAGDSWSTVITIIDRMCTMREAEGYTEYVYNGKVVGWTRHSDGARWCDHDAYIAMREAYNALPKEEPIVDLDEDDDYIGDREPADVPDEDVDEVPYAWTPDPEDEE